MSKEAGKANQQNEQATTEMSHLTSYLHPNEEKTSKMRQAQNLVEKTYFFLHLSVNFKKIQKRHSLLN